MWDCSGKLQLNIKEEVKSVLVNLKRTVATTLQAVYIFWMFLASILRSYFSLCTYIRLVLCNNTRCLSCSTDKSELVEKVLDYNDWVVYVWNTGRVTKTDEYGWDIDRIDTESKILAASNGVRESGLSKIECLCKTDQTWNAGHTSRLSY